MSIFTNFVENWENEFIWWRKFQEVFVFRFAHNMTHALIRKKIRLLYRKKIQSTTSSEMHYDSLWNTCNPYEDCALFILDGLNRANIFESKIYGKMCGLKMLIFQWLNRMYFCARSMEVIPMKIHSMCWSLWSPV